MKFGAREKEAWIKIYLPEKENSRLFRLENWSEKLKTHCERVKCEEVINTPAHVRGNLHAHTAMYAYRYPNKQVAAALT